MKTTFYRLLLIIFTISLYSCAHDEEERVIRIGTNVWPGYEPLYLAREMKLFSSEEIQLVEYQSASEVIRAFRNHLLEAASLTIDEALLLKNDNIPVKIVLIHDISAGADVILAKPEIRNFADLKGKRIGVESTALGAFVLTRAAQINNMNISDFEIIKLEINLHKQSYLNNEVDAVVTFDPVRTNLIKAGAHEIFNSNQIPGEVVDVMVVHEDTLKSGKKRLKAIVNAWFEALEYFNKETDSAARIMAKRLRIEPEEVIASYEGLKLPDRNTNLRLMDGVNPKLEETSVHLAEVLFKNKLINSPIDTRGMVTSELLFEK